MKFIEGKLHNEKFTDKAPAEIIKKEKEKLAQAKMTLQKLLHHQLTIKNL